MFYLVHPFCSLQKSDISNRFVIYLTIFIFSIGVFSGAGSLPSGPSVVGLTMLQRMTFALIPTTALLTVWSIFRIVMRRSKRPTIISHPSLLRVGDIFAGVFVVALVYYLTSFSGIQNYTFNPKTGLAVPVITTYNLLDFKDLHYWGYAIIGLTSIGFVCQLLILAWYTKRKYDRPKLITWEKL
jgi:hypothetical protein